MCNSSKVARLGRWMHRIAGAQPLPCSLRGLPLFSSCPPSPLPRDSSPTPTQNKRATFRKKAIAPIDEPGVAILAKDTLPAHQLPVRCRWCKKKRREKFASSGVLPKPSPFPPEGEKTQDGEGSKENLGFRVFPRKKKKIGWADGRTDGRGSD